MSATAISAAVVSELRRETGVGMMDCKKALEEAGGDKEKALEALRKKGMAAAEKRAARSAEEGVVVARVSDDGHVGALVQVNSETDFVARNEEFKKYAADVAELVLNWKDAAGKSLDHLKASAFRGKTVEGSLTELIGKIGEKLEVRNFARVDAGGGYVGSYIHSDSKLGVLVELGGITNATPDVKQLGRDLAMQVAAAHPTVVRREEMPKEKIDSEMKIEEERARAEGKPEPAVAKIAQGRVGKWLSSVVLLEQPFVKEQKETVSDVVARVAASSGQKIEVKSFVRFRVGE